MGCGFSLLLMILLVGTIAVLIVVWGRLTRLIAASGVTVLSEVFVSIIRRLGAVLGTGLVVLVSVVGLSGPAEASTPDELGVEESCGPMTCTYYFDRKATLALSNNHDLSEVEAACSALAAFKALPVVAVKCGLQQIADDRQSAQIAEWYNEGNCAKMKVVRYGLSDKPIYLESSFGYKNCGTTGASGSW